MARASRPVETRRTLTGVLAIIGAFLLGLGGAYLGLGSSLGEGTVQPPGWLPVLMALVGVVFLVAAVAAIVHLLRREDLTAQQTLVLCLAVVLVPGGGVAYFVVGPQRVGGWVSSSP